MKTVADVIRTMDPGYRFSRLKGKMNVYLPCRSQHLDVLVWEVALLQDLYLFIQLGICVRVLVFRLVVIVLLSPLKSRCHGVSC